MRNRRYSHGNLLWASRLGCACEECCDAQERSKMRTPSLPVGPLRAFLPQAEWESDQGHARRVGGVNAVLTTTQQKMLFRALSADAITPRAADELAVALHRHPMEIWGMDWFS